MKSFSIKKKILIISAISGVIVLSVLGVVKVTEDTITQLNAMADRFVVGRNADRHLIAPVIVTKEVYVVKVSPKD